MHTKSIEGDPPADKPARAQRPLLAVSMTLVAGLLFSMQDAGVKWLSDDYHVLLPLFVRSVVVALAFGLLARGARGASLAVLWRGPSLGLLWVRSLLACTSWAVFYFALASLPLTALTTLMFTMPLFVALLAGPLLGERMGARRLAVVLLGFCGVMVVVRPGGGLFEPAALLALLAALCYALMVITTRALSATVGSAGMVLHLSLTLTSLSALALPWSWRTPAAGDLLLMVGIGAIVGVAQFALAQAYRFGTTVLVAPFDYVRLVWALAWGWLLFGELPDIVQMTGCAVVVASGLLLLRAERGRGG